jgi:hypothetical protein
VTTDTPKHATWYNPRHWRKTSANTPTTNTRSP